MTDASVVRSRTGAPRSLHDSLAQAERSAKLLDAARLWQSA